MLYVDTEVFLSDEMGSLRGKPQSAFVFYLPLGSRAVTDCDSRTE